MGLKFDWTITIGQVGSIVSVFGAIMLLAHKHSLTFALLEQSVKALRETALQLKEATTGLTGAFHEIDKRVTVLESKEEHHGRKG